MDYKSICLTAFLALSLQFSWAGTPDLLSGISPLPQQIEITNASGLQADQFRWISTAADLSYPVMGEQLDRLPRFEGKGAGIRLVLTEEGVPESEEGYLLEITRKGAVISSRGEAGIFYGCQTLDQLMEESRETGQSIPQMKITDWPSIPYRAVHFDCKNHLDRTEYYYYLIDQLASYKVNAVIWEIEDKLRYERRPEVAAPNAISKQEMQAICRYARDRHVEISPLIQGLGHASYILKHHWELRENPERNGDFCPSDPRTYEVLFSMYRDALEAMPYGRYLHLGGDEVGRIGVDDRCRATGKNAFELQLEWMRKVSDFAEENGRTPIFWDDMPLKHARLWASITRDMTDEQVRQNMDFHKMEDAVSQFPKNMVFMRWYYGDPMRLGNIMALDWYSEKGIKVIGATAASEARCIILPRPDGRIPYIKSFSELVAERGLEGIFATAWDDGSPHLATVERSFYAQGEFGWNPSGRTCEEFMEAYARREFGLQAEDLRFIKDMETNAFFFDGALAVEGHRSPAFQVKDFKVIDLPVPSAPGKWSAAHNGLVQEASVCLKRYSSIADAVDFCRSHALRGRYVLEVYDVTNELLVCPAKILLALDRFDQASGEQKKAAAEELRALCKDFYNMKARLTEVYSKTRFMNVGNGYHDFVNPHNHLAAKTFNEDWIFLFELPVIRNIEAMLAGMD